jgi:hypothetical protein
MNFVKDRLQDNWIQPWWDIVDGNKVYKMKFYSGGIPIIDKRTLELSMELGILSGELVKSRLPFPHDLEYEKTFWPFLILTKKRYVGNKYEFDPKKYKQDFMGIVLKRRDNAPIVKEVCSGIIDYLINKRDPDGAKEFTIKCLENMFEGKYDIKYFLQSRTLKLKESYADWTKIAHVFLSEQIAIRDPGNKPQSGDRIEFAVIVPPVNEDPKKKFLQGEMIEIPSYIKQNNIPLNYMFYMKNQIMKPALQFLKLVDPNAENIFLAMEEKYGNIKPKKEPKPKVVKEIKPKKESKPRVVKIKNAASSSFTDVVKTSKKRVKKVVATVADTTNTDTVNPVDALVIQQVEEVVIKKKKKSDKVQELVEEQVIEVAEPVIEVIKKKKKSDKVQELVEEQVIEVAEPVIELIKEKKKSDKVQEQVIEVAEPVIEVIKKKKKSDKVQELVEEQVIEVAEPVIEVIKKKKKSDKVQELVIEVPEPVIEQLPEPVIEQLPEPVIEVVEPVIEVIKKKKKSEPVIEQLPEPVIEVPEPVIEVIKKKKKSDKVQELVIEVPEPVIEVIKKKKKSDKVQEQVIEVPEVVETEVVNIKKKKSKDTVI